MGQQSHQEVPGELLWVLWHEDSVSCYFLMGQLVVPMQHSCCCDWDWNDDCLEGEEGVTEEVVPWLRTLW